MNKSAQNEYKQMTVMILNFYGERNKHVFLILINFSVTEILNGFVYEMENSMFI